MFKKVLAYVLCVAVSALIPAAFSSCGAGDVRSDVLPKDVVEDIVSDYTLDGGFLFRSDSTEEGEYLDEDLISTYYGDGEKVPDFSAVDSYCVYIDESDAREMCEGGLFRFRPDSGADLYAFESFLKNRVEVRLSNARSYPDINKSTLKGAKFAVAGNYVYYAVVKGESAGIAERIDLLLRGRDGEA